MTGDDLSINLYLMLGEDEDPRVIKGLDRRILWRSFFLETLWNYGKMQNVGFLFCIYPVLKRLYPGEQERNQAVERHLVLVNTHPALGTLLAGLTSRLEYDYEPAKVIPYRGRVMTALAAYGDRIFWRNLRPLAAVTAVLLCLCFFGSFVGTVALLVLYNVPQLWLRARGFRRGWEEGLKTLQRLASPPVELAVRLMRGATSLLAGLVVGFATYAAMQSLPSAGSGLAPIFCAGGLLALVGLAFLLIKGRVSLTMVVYPATLLGLMIVLLVGF